MAITSTWTTPSSLDRAINDILTEAIWDNLVSNELYLYDTLLGAARTVSLLRAVFPTDTTGGVGSIWQDAAGGLVIQGVTGSSYDFTLLNNAGAGVLSAPTGTQNLDLGGRLRIVTNVAGAAGTLYKDAAAGMVLWGVTGSSYDFALLNNAGAGVLNVPTATQNVQFNGAILATAAANNTVPVVLADSILGADTASISLTSLPSNYRHLQIVITARGTTAATTVDVLMRFNNDTGATYDRSFHRVTGSNTYAGDGAGGATSAYAILSCPAASATANWFGHADIVVSSYTATDKFKPFAGKCSYNQGSYMGVETVAGQWGSTSAINRVDILCSAGSLKAGSRMTIYGLP